MRQFGGASSVRSLTSLSGLIKGSPFQRDALARGQCPPPNLEFLVPPEYPNRPTDACREMAQGGEEVVALNPPSDALPGIHYTNITSTQETDAAPYEINLMTGPGNHENIVTQDYCPTDRSFT